MSAYRRSADEQDETIAALRAEVKTWQGNFNIRESQRDEARKERDGLRARLESTERDLIATAAELVACQKERDAMRAVVEAAKVWRAAVRSPGWDSGQKAVDLSLAVREYEKEAK